MEKWHKVEVYRAHNSGKKNMVMAAIFGENALDVFNKYQTMRGVKRNIRQGDPFPNILPMSEEEALETEKRIISEGLKSLYNARRSWYYLTMV